MVACPEPDDWYYVIRHPESLQIECQLCGTGWVGGTEESLYRSLILHGIGHAMLGIGLKFGAEA